MRNANIGLALPNHVLRFKKLDVMSSKVFSDSQLSAADVDIKALMYETTL